MYDGAVTNIRNIREETNTFSVKIGLHQESALSLSLYVCCRWSILVAPLWDTRNQL